MKKKLYFDFLLLSGILIHKKQNRFFFKKLLQILFWFAMLTIVCEKHTSFLYGKETLLFLEIKKRPVWL